MSASVVEITSLAVPRTLDQATDKAWLSQALASLTGGAAITSVEVVEVQKTMATKARFRASWDGGEAALCLKAFLDSDDLVARSGNVTITEADFYGQVSSQVTLRAPTCVVSVLDRPTNMGLLIMRDLVAEGARFCTALEPLGPDQTAASLDQLARLHARPQVLETAPWIDRRVHALAYGGYTPEPLLQEMLDGPRGVTLDPATRSAAGLLKAVQTLAVRDAELPATLVHGDCHAGNIYVTADGPGLIDWQLLQRGGWALDVAYHIAATLPVETAEREEWRLLRDYLDRARGHGAEPPDFETAREQYRASAVWGYFLWAITKRVDPNIINAFVGRLGASVARHDSFALLGA